MPKRIATASSTVGSSTITGWKRRSSAASFSMYLRYSSRVVAPMHCSSPRASGGLRMFAASMAPSAAPAPTSVCSSSMKSTLSLLLRSSSMIFLSRSSNSPRYFVPATSDPMSSVSTRLSISVSGTSPLMIRWASPSAIAVLPTPGSPMRAGLFFVRRLRIWMTRSISFSRPMTGSSLPARAASVRLMPSWSRVGVFEGRFVSCAGEALELCDRTWITWWRTLSRFTPERLEHAGRDPLALAHEAEQEVLGADVVVTQASRLVDGELDDALGARREADFADDRPIAATDDELDRGPHLRELDVHVLEHARRDALTLAHQAEQQVLGPDVVVVEALGLILGKGEDLSRPVGELVESVHGRLAWLELSTSYDHAGMWCESTAAPACGCRQ